MNFGLLFLLGVFGLAVYVWEIVEEFWGYFDGE